MFQMLINLVFTIVATIVQVITAPLIEVVLAAFPDLTTHAANIMNFFTLAFQYLTTVARWFLFTPSMFVLLFDYFAIKFSVWLTASTVRLSLKLYNILKP